MKKHIAAALISVLTVFMVLPMQGLAAGHIDLNRDVSLAISYQDRSTPLIGAEFDIYKVAAVDETGKLTPTKEFAPFNVNIQGKNDEEWRTLASTLEGYVLRDQITPTDSETTDNKGLACFPAPGRSLTPGLYLAIGKRHTQNGCRYDPASFMVMLPGVDKENSNWVYDRKVNAKYVSSKLPKGSDDHTIQRKALKVWKDDEHEQERPEEVIVQLLRGDKVYDTVTLRADNNWRHTWTGLDDRYAWTVVEKETEGYTVEVVQEGITFVVTNTYKENTPDEPIPTVPTSEVDIPNAPTPLGQSTGENIPNESTPTMANKSSEPTLPQTGQLWWPVPVLMIAGKLLVLIGLFRRGEMIDDE